MANVPTTRPATSDRPSLAGGGAPHDSRGAWLALAAALLGWMFDGFEMGLFSLVGRSAVADLLQLSAKPTDAENQQIGLWFGVILALFLVGAATGGVVFGWLGDRIGRVRAMSLSVLTYALFTGLCGVAQDKYQIGALRFIASLGMGGEWSLGVALVMEIWPNRSRAFMAGLIGAAANVGYLLVAVVGMGLLDFLSTMKEWMSSVGMTDASIDWLTRFQGWRLMMMVGALPALLTFFIRLFVPESKRWEEEKKQGSTLHWATADLLGVLIGAIGPTLIIGVWVWNTIPTLLELTRLHVVVQILATIAGVVIAALGYLWPAQGFLRRAQESGMISEADRRQTIRRMLLGACLSGVALLATWGSAQWAPGWAAVLTEKLDPAPKYPREWTQFWSAAGAIVGTILAALACDRMGRRMTYRVICVLSMASLVFLYLGSPVYNQQFLIATFLVGVCTAAFYGWLPLYLPELFRTSVRATGQGFGFNFGRILAAIGAVQTGNLIGFFKSDIQLPFFDAPIKAWPVACATMSVAYLVGLIVIQFAPETKGKPLPD